MRKTIKYTITTLILTLCILTTGVFAEKADKSDKTEVDAISSAQTSPKKNEKAVGDDSNQPNIQELETQKYPIYVNYNNSTSVDLLTEKQLDSLYKYFADNVKTTYPTMDESDILIFDQNNIYKLTKDLKNQLRKMDSGKEVIPNATALLNTKPIETDYTTTLYCLIILISFAFFRFTIGAYVDSKNAQQLDAHKEN